MRFAWQRICLTAVVSVFPLVVLAQSQPLESEYKKLIHVDTDISPLGATPFGENVSTYDGSLSFEQTDFSLKGDVGYTMRQVALVTVLLSDSNVS